MFYLLATLSNLSGCSTICMLMIYSCTSFNPNDHVSIRSALNNLLSCIDALKIWLQNNMLKLNDDKTEFFVAVPAHLKRNVLPVSLNIGNKSISPSDRVRNLRVIFDSEMSLSGHVNSLCSSLTYQLCNISRIRRFLDYDTCHLITRAFVLSRIERYSKTTANPELGCEAGV